MLNLAVKNKPPRARSPKPSPRRAHFTSSLPVYSSRENDDDDINDDGDLGLGASLPPTPATLPLNPSPLSSSRGRLSPSPLPSSRARTPYLPASPMMAKKSMSLDSSVRRKTLSLDRQSSRGHSLDLSGILKQSMSQNDMTMTSTFGGTSVYHDDFRQNPQQTKNLVTKFSKVDKVLQPGYDRIIRASSQTYPFYHWTENYGSVAPISGL